MLTPERASTETCCNSLENTMIPEGKWLLCTAGKRSLSDVCHDQRVIEVNHTLDSSETQPPHCWTQHFGEYPGCQGQSKQKIGKFSLLKRIEEDLIVCAYEIRVLEIDSALPVLFLKKIPDDVKTLHFEMDVREESVQLPKIHYRPHLSLLLLWS